MAVPKNAIDSIKSYRIHDNGGSPFTVVMKRSNEDDDSLFNVDVFRNVEQPYNVKKHLEMLDRTYFTINSRGQQLHVLEAPSKKPVLRFKNVKTFVGKSPKAFSTLRTKAYGKRYDGNSILIEVDAHELKYVYIGERIFSFVAFTPIVQYLSPVWNNDCPSPYAIDEDLNHYLMTSRVVLTRVKSCPSFSLKPRKFDPYLYYFGDKDFRGGGDDIPGYAVYMPDEDYPNDNPEDDVYQMTYHPNFKIDKRFKSYFRYKIGSKTPAFNANGELPPAMTDEEVFRVVKRFASKHGYEDFPFLKILEKRKY